MSVRATMEQYKGRVDAELRELLAVCCQSAPGGLVDAIEYAVFPGGKRLRPVLVLSACELSGGDLESALAPACAVELIHCSSLVHDDLPCMDDDDLRRGRPSCHRAFGEAMAVLVGDALFTLAFEWMARAVVSAGERAAGRLTRATIEIASAAGPVGMIGGQVLDIEPAGNEVTAAGLDRINERKTGALISCCLRAGGIVGGASEADLGLLTVYGDQLGRAFQIADDLLDDGSDCRAGADGSANPGYPAVVGVDVAQTELELATMRAIEALSQFGDRGQFLRDLASLMQERVS